MTFTLTLPVMLAVAIASTVSRSLSYGTIYTTKLRAAGRHGPVHVGAPCRASVATRLSHSAALTRAVLTVSPTAKEPGRDVSEASAGGRRLHTCGVGAGENTMVSDAQIVSLADEDVQPVVQVPATRPRSNRSL